MKNPLFLVFILPLLTDTTLTLLGQNQTYWNNFKSANEMAPVYYLLKTHPAVFIAASLIWYIFLYWLIKKLKYPLNLIVALSLMVGHTVGSQSWIKKMLYDSGIYVIGDRGSTNIAWLILVGYYVLVGTVAALSISKYFKNRA